MGVDFGETPVFFARVAGTLGPEVPGVFSRTASIEERSPFSLEE